MVPILFRAIRTILHLKLGSYVPSAALLLSETTSSHGFESYSATIFDSFGVRPFVRFANLDS